MMEYICHFPYADLFIFQILTSLNISGNDSILHIQPGKTFNLPCFLRHVSEDITSLMFVQVPVLDLHGKTFSFFLIDTKNIYLIAFPVSPVSNFGILWSHCVL